MMLVGTISVQPLQAIRQYLGRVSARTSHRSPSIATTCPFHVEKSRYDIVMVVSLRSLMPRSTHVLIRHTEWPMMADCSDALNARHVWCLDEFPAQVDPDVAPGLLSPDTLPPAPRVRAPEAHDLVDDAQRVDAHALLHRMYFLGSCVATLIALRKRSIASSSTTQRRHVMWRGGLSNSVAPMTRHPHMVNSSLRLLRACVTRPVSVQLTSPGTRCTLPRRHRGPCGASRSGSPSCCQPLRA
jgi:hypothetical protein